MKDVPRSCGSGNPAFRRKDPCYLCGAPPDLGNPTVKNCFKSNYRSIGSYNLPKHIIYELNLKRDDALDELWDHRRLEGSEVRVDLKKYEMREKVR